MDHGIGGRCGKAAKLRSRRVAILRNRSHYLGDVQAADQNAAEAAAASEFNLSDDQRKRVVVQERDSRSRSTKHC